MTPPCGPSCGSGTCRTSPPPASPPPTTSRCWPPSRLSMGAPPPTCAATTPASARSRPPTISPRCSRSRSARPEAGRDHLAQEGHHFLAVGQGPRDHLGNLFGAEEHVDGAHHDDHAALDAGVVDARHLAPLEALSVAE